MTQMGVCLSPSTVRVWLWSVILSLFLLMPLNSVSQCPGYLLLYSQADVDSFAIEYPNCTEIEGQVYINGDDITNLQGLSSLDSILGEFHIVNNPILETLSGLENLTYIGAWTQIVNNNSLTSINELSSLNYVGSELDIMENPVLQSIVGLSNFETCVGGINITDNPMLQSIVGLSNLETCDGSIYIRDNLSLSNLQGLESLSMIPHLTVSGNDSLISLAGLENLQLVYGLSISNNVSLTNLVGLDSLNTVWGNLSISGSGFTDLTGLQNLEFIYGGLTLSHLYNLQNLNGLIALEAMNISLVIKQCNSLVTLSGLESLQGIGGSLKIIENNSLQSLSGIDNINPQYITNLSINYNPQLSICEVQSVCDYLASPNGAIQIYVNAPGCNNSLEIEDACESIGISELESDIPLSAFPNPFTTSATIEYELKEISNIQFTIYNVIGEVVYNAEDHIMPQGIHTVTWSPGHLPEGLYYGVLRSEGGVSVIKMIKQ